MACTRAPIMFAMRYANWSSSDNLDEPADDALCGELVNASAIGCDVDANRLRSFQ